MDSKKIRQFLELAGQDLPLSFETGDEQKRKLGAQLLLSELLEYIIKGLKIHPEYQGVAITNPEGFVYNSVPGAEPDKEEMLDGLADVAYTMYWNSEAFAIPLEKGFELVCDNNLEKFVKLNGWSKGEGQLEAGNFDCGEGIAWPQEVTQVWVKKVSGEYYAVGKDINGKVRKPSNYKPVDLSGLLS